MIKPNIAPTLGTRLLAWRRAHHFTQIMAARELGFPLRTYQDIERGVSEASGFTRTVLVRMLDNFESQPKTPTP